MFLPLFGAALALFAMAQQEPYKERGNKKNKDSVHGKNFILIERWDSTNSKKSQKGGSITIRFSGKDSCSPKDTSQVKTNWGVFDLGFANYTDDSNYPSAIAAGYLKPGIGKSNMKLNASKSSNVNIWILMQRRPLIAKNCFVKYGVGFEMFNFRFDNWISYRQNPSPNVFMDTSVSFSKNKLFVSYLSIPLMFNLTNGKSGKNQLSGSLGISAGYLLAARNKQISTQRGKEKFRGNFDLLPWRLAAIGELAIGHIRFFSSYSLTPLHDQSTHLSQNPYSFGVRFSKW